jgi:DNA-binding CsgD family transcriptional regulator
VEHRWRAATSTFVGRERELEELRIHLAETGAGQGRLLLLVGEPGIGKTRTIREMAAEAHRDGVLVLWGRGYEGDWSRPYGLWVEVLAGYTRSLGAERLREMLGPSLGLLARLVPGLTDERPEGPLGASHQERFGLCDAVATLLLQASAEQTVLLVLDDLHWADRDSLALLSFVARELQRPEPVAGPRLLLVGAYREEDLGQQHPLEDVLAELKHAPDYERIAIGGLGESEVAQYLVAVTGHDPRPSVVRRIHVETEGNPFYLRELVRHLLEEGRPLGDDLGPAAESDEAELSVPEGVRRVVARRVARLAVGTRAALGVAAAFPRGFEPRVLRELLDQGDDALLDSLDEARRAGLIRAVTGRPGLYRFVHALTRHAVYDELSASRRARLHHQIAETLERLHASDLESRLSDLAYHHAEALPVGDAAKALEFTIRTGDRAARMLAYEEAARHYERGLRILDLETALESAPELAKDGSPSFDADLRRCDLLLALGETRRRAGHGALAKPSPAKRALLEAAEIARRLRPRIGGHEAGLRLARAALAYRGVMVDAGAVDAVRVALLEEALDGLDDGDSGLRARLLARLATELYFADQPERRVALSREAVAMARRVGDPAALAYALETSHLARWGPDNVAERIAITDELLGLAEAVGDPELMLLGQGWRVPDLLELGEITAVDAAIAAHARLAEALRQPFYRFNSTMWRAMRALLSGRLAEAEELSLQMLAIGRQMQDPDAELLFGMQIFALRREQGRLGELEGAMRVLVARYDVMPAARCRLAYLYAALGREQAARAELDRLAACDFADLPRDLTWLSSATLLADACAMLGDARRAEPLYALLLPYAERTVVVDHAIACGGAVSRSLGLLAQILGRGEEAGRHFEHALGLHERLGAGPLLAWTRFEYARMLLANDGRAEAERAGALLDQALDTAHEMGLAELQAQATALRAVAGPPARAAGARWAPSNGRPAGAGAGEPDADYPGPSLTPREREVVVLVAQGLTNRQIAERLVVSNRTVEMHVTNVLTKLGITSRSQAAIWAYQHGLVAARSR